MSEIINNILWISYDLGMNGDYDGMYTFLDKNKAVECGDSMARIINYNIGKDFRKDLLSKMKKNVELDSDSRVYYIFHDKERGILRSGFIWGKRKRAPWYGYDDDLSDIYEDEND